MGPSRVRALPAPPPPTPQQRQRSFSHLSSFLTLFPDKSYNSVFGRSPTTQQGANICRAIRPKEPHSRPAYTPAPKVAPLRSSKHGHSPALSLENQNPSSKPEYSGSGIDHMQMRLNCDLRFFGARTARSFGCRAPTPPNQASVSRTPNPRRGHPRTAWDP